MSFGSQDGVKPIQVAAARDNRRAVEILFPLTSKVDTIRTWTIDGILEYMQSETKNQQVFNILLLQFYHIPYSNPSQLKRTTNAF